MIPQKLFKYGAILFLLILICLACVCLFVFLYPKMAIEQFATYYIGKPVSIGEFRFARNEFFHFELSEIHIQNTAWGSTPDMLYIGHLSGTMDLASLLKKAPFIQDLSLENAQLVLERNADGIGNWKKSSHPSSTHMDLREEAKNQREHLPTILNLALKNAHVSFRTSEGSLLLVDLERVALDTPSQEQPILMTVHGAYNHHPVDLNIKAASFNDFHDADKAFHTDIQIKGGDGVIKLEAALMDPLNFDDVSSSLDFSTANLGAMVKVFGENFDAKIPITVKGHLERQNDNWYLTDAHAKANDTIFDANLNFIEGPRHGADTIHGQLDFARLNIDNLLNSLPKPKADWQRNNSFIRADVSPDPVLDLSFKSKETNYKNLHAIDMRLHIAMKPSHTSIDDFSMKGFNGSIDGSLQANIQHGTNKTQANLAVSKLSIIELLHFAGKDAGFLAGHLDGWLQLHSEGNTLDEIKRQSDGQIIISIGDAIMRTDIIRTAALDIHSLFDRDQHPVTCILAVGILHNENMNVNPVRIKSPSGTLFGAGTLDFNADLLDLTFRTDPNTTGDLALDIPIHAHGNLQNPTITIGSKDEVSALKFETKDNVDQLSPGFQKFYKAHNCR